MNTVKTARLLGAALLLPAASMTGCSFGTSIDNIMAPPKLSVEQEQIYSALTDAAGSSISLKYPRSGKYLSAFIVEDIDGDGGNEAVVFYERSGLGVEENTLRINVLDKDGDAWRSVCDTPAEGSEIEKVMISRLGTNDRVNLIIGSSLINRSEKNVTMYNYENGSLTATIRNTVVPSRITSSSRLKMRTRGSASRKSAAPENTIRPISSGSTVLPSLLNRS